ncbi:MAG: hypothetical protein JWO93_2167, partial [Micrococcaceae bacterium]|nr:hypothetical protein [Micrococcaceae bacterium]
QMAGKARGLGIRDADIRMAELVLKAAGQ